MTPHTASASTLPDGVSCGRSRFLQGDHPDALADRLPDLSASIPTSGIPEDAPGVLAELGPRPFFLMVGTIEPRKGHAQAVAAFDRLWRGGVDANLVIVGYEGWKGVAASHRQYILYILHMVEKFHRHPQAGKCLFWLEGISDEYLEKIYAACTPLLFAS